MFGRVLPIWNLKFLPICMFGMRIGHLHKLCQPTKLSRLRCWLLHLTSCLGGDELQPVQRWDIQLWLAKFGMHELSSIQYIWLGFFVAVLLLQFGLLCEFSTALLYRHM